ncbi:hypothetical protein LEMLEM_LOCUS27819 [Lemmus lemmus]
MGVHTKQPTRTLPDALRKGYLGKGARTRRTSRLIQLTQHGKGGLGDHNNYTRRYPEPRFFTSGVPVQQCGAPSPRVTSTGDPQRQTGR